MTRTLVAICTLAFLLTVAGCGDDEEPSRTAAETTPTTGATFELPGSTAPEGTTAEPESTSPEDQPGGAGDEEAARTEVVLEFSRGGLAPEEVRVAPFIPVVLMVRSDGTEYDLSYTAPTAGGGANGTSEADFEIDGLRPGQRIEIEERNTGSRAVVIASDEAGP